MKCVICGREPKDIQEYVRGAEDEGYDSSEEFVINDEGTYNEDENIFCCDTCYVACGMPQGVAQLSWKTLV